MGLKTNLKKQEVLEIVVGYFENIHENLENEKDKDKKDKLYWQYLCMVDLLKMLDITEE